MSETLLKAEPANIIIDAMHLTKEIKKVLYYLFWLIYGGYPREEIKHWLVVTLEVMSKRYKCGLSREEEADMAGIGQIIGDLWAIVTRQIREGR